MSNVQLLDILISSGFKTSFGNNFRSQHKFIFFFEICGGYCSAFRLQIFPEKYFDITKAQITKINRTSWGVAGWVEGFMAHPYAELWGFGQLMAPVA